MTMATANLIAPFIEAVRVRQIEIYNEFSLQHQLGIFLRGAHPKEKVQFERNVSYFFPGKSLTKREIDITIFSRECSEFKWAIELKYPRNGQYPEQMFAFCKDLVFIEELKAAGFLSAGLLIFADDPPFFRGSTEGIYGFFRGGRPLCGRIQKPTGSKDAELNVRGTYIVEWKRISGDLMYAWIEAKTPAAVLGQDGVSPVASSSGAGSGTSA